MDDLDQRGRKAERKVDAKESRKAVGAKPGDEDLMEWFGEMHAYRALQNSYGADVVTPSCWKSENSRYSTRRTRPTMDTDATSLFRRVEIHYIEVKATQGDDNSFELGSTEVELAIDKANRRKESFHILHVVNALSETPRSGIGRTITTAGSQKSIGSRMRTARAVLSFRDVAAV